MTMFMEIVFTRFRVTLAWEDSCRNIIVKSEPWKFAFAKLRLCTITRRSLAADETAGRASIMIYSRLICAHDVHRTHVLRRTRTESIISLRHGALMPFQPREMWHLRESQRAIIGHSPDDKSNEVSRRLVYLRRFALAGQFARSTFWPSTTMTGSDSRPTRIVESLSAVAAAQPTICNISFKRGKCGFGRYNRVWV